MARDGWDDRPAANSKRNMSNRSPPKSRPPSGRSTDWRPSSARCGTSASDSHVRTCHDVVPLRPPASASCSRELRRLDRRAGQARSRDRAGIRSRTETAARKAFEQAKAKLESKHTAERRRADRDYEQAKKRANVKAEEGLKAARNTHGTAREEALERYQTAEEDTTREYQEAKWTQDAMLEARAKKAKSLREQARRQYAAQTQAAADLRQEALDQLQKWKLVPAGAGEDEKSTTPADPLPVVTSPRRRGPRAGRSA